MNPIHFNQRLRGESDCGLEVVERGCVPISGTSRSRFAMSGRWMKPAAAGYCNVLRLVEDDTAALRFG